MFNATEVAGNTVRKNDVFVTADTRTVTFDRVVDLRADGDTVKVVTLSDTFDGFGPVSLGDISLSTLSDADTVNVIRA